MNKHEDALGTPIIPGNIIAYGTRVGNSGALRFGLVESLHIGSIGIRQISEGYDGTLRKGTRTRLRMNKRIVNLSVNNLPKLETALKPNSCQTTNQ